MAPRHSRPSPPRLAGLALRIILHPDDRAPALADLDEEFRVRARRDGAGAARRWYRTQVVLSVWPSVQRRFIDARRGPALLTEIRWAWRGLRARPFGGLLHVVLVALASGASAVVFSAADAFVFRPAPYPNADRLVIFQRPSPVGLVDYLQVDEYVALRSRSDLFSGMFGHLMAGSVAITAAGVTDFVRMEDVEPGLFDALGVVPRWGRPLSAGDDSSPGASTVVIREDLAHRVFGDPGTAVGQAIETPGGSLRIAGVMPARFRFPTSLEMIWRARADAHPRERLSTSVIAVLAPGGSMRSLEHAVSVLARAGGVPSQGPISAVPLSKAKKDPRAFTNAGAFTSGDAPRLFTLLLGAAVCLALIVCFNIAGLELTSALERTRVFAVQTALGATRWMLIRTVLLEGAFLALAGSVAGLALAVWGTSALSAALPTALDAILANPIDVDLRTAAFFAIVTAASTVFITVPIAWHIGRRAPGHTLRLDAVRTTGSRTQAAIRHSLVTAQVGLSVMLLAGAVLFVRTYVARVGEDKGFDSANLATLDITRPRGAPVGAADLGQSVIARLQSHPAVVSVARTERLPPMVRGGVAQHLWIAGDAAPAGQAMLTSFAVDPGYFETMGIRLLGGRLPSAADSENQVVVDESLARRFWPDGRAVGARYSLGTAQAPGRQIFEIVGVTSRVRLDAAAAPMGGEIFVVHRAMPRNSAPLTFAVRLRPDARDRLAELTTLVRSLAPASVVRTGWMDDRYVQMYGSTRVAAGVTAGFGAMAATVAMVGLYGVTAFLVAGRTREIGIRIALGATGRDIRRLAMRPAMRCVALGLGAGITGALLASRWIGSQLFGVQPTDPATYAGVATATAITALVATWRPARRAAAVDPAITLRAE